MASAPLWDQDLRRVIYGCKIYRHALLVGIPFEPHVLGDTHDRRVWERHGLSSAKAPRTEQDCVGLHGTHYTPEQAFARWRGMWQRHRMTGNMKWIESWLSKLGNRYRTSGSRVDLFAMIGAYVGATETLWSEDASRCNAALAELLARVPEAE